MAAANMCMKLAKRRSELLGLDREQKVMSTLQMNFGADAIESAVRAAQDPRALEAMEILAAQFAHGVIEGEAEELGAGRGLADGLEDEVHDHGERPADSDGDGPERADPEDAVEQDVPEGLEHQVTE
jgi:hypothetical protein